MSVNLEEFLKPKLGLFSFALLTIIAVTHSARYSLVSVYLDETQAGVVSFALLR